jgi:hypothetical protein
LQLTEDQSHREDDYKLSRHHEIQRANLF